MFLRPARTVRVTTKAELDAALNTAEQITVEGDDELLSYAASKVANDPESRVTVEIGDHAVDVGRAPSPTPPAQVVVGEAPRVRKFIERRRVPPASGVQRPMITDNERAAAPPKRAFSRTTIIALAIFGMLALGLAAYIHVRNGNPGSPPPAPPAPAPVGTPAPAPPAPVGSPQIGGIPLSPHAQVKNTGANGWEVGNGDHPTVAQTLAWPSVAVIAIIAMFLIAWRAITTGSNVSMSWKITEKVQGRVVITKVKTQAVKGHAAA